MHFRMVLLSMCLLKPWNWQHSFFFSFLHPCWCTKMFHILYNLFSFLSSFLQGCCHLPSLGRHHFFICITTVLHLMFLFPVLFLFDLSLLHANHHVNVPWLGALPPMDKHNSRSPPASFHFHILTPIRAGQWTLNLLHFLIWVLGRVSKLHVCSLGNFFYNMLFSAG